MSKRKPIIGVNTSLRTTNSQPEAFIPTAYLDAVSAGGGIPVALAPLNNTRAASRLLEAVDALLLIGGDDLDPSAWGEKKHPRAHLMPARRNAFDLSLCRAALRRKMPILGICCGHQCLNVALGGSIHQHLYDNYGRAVIHHGRKHVYPSHGITVYPGTRLADIVGKGHLPVNTSHHQSVNRLGKHLIISAISSKDQVIEGIEMVRPGQFALGVQWHPEVLISKPRHRAVFEALAEEALRYHRAQA